MGSMSVSISTSRQPEFFDFLGQAPSLLSAFEHLYRGATALAIEMALTLRPFHLPKPAASVIVLPRKSQAIRTYYSHEHARPPLYTAPESHILSAALTHVPAQGFTTAALRSGLRDAGYLDASTSLFPQGGFSLVLYHLRTQRHDLRDRIQFPETSEGARPLSLGLKVRSTILARLQGNVEAGVVGRWSEALGMMSLAGSIPTSLRELGLLSDEIWFLAGDSSVDTSWYTKRASLSAVYAATEMFQTQDQSTGYKDTEQFLDRRLEEVRVLGGAARNISEWLGFQGVAAVNLARSLGARI